MPKRKKKYNMPEKIDMEGFKPKAEPKAAPKPEPEPEAEPELTAPTSNDVGEQTATKASAEGE